MTIFDQTGPVASDSAVEMEKMMYARASPFTEVTDLLVNE